MADPESDGAPPYAPLDIDASGADELVARYGGLAVSNTPGAFAIGGWSPEREAVVREYVVLGPDPSGAGPVSPLSLVPFAAADEGTPSICVHGGAVLVGRTLHAFGGFSDFAMGKLAPADMWTASIDEGLPLRWLRHSAPGGPGPRAYHAMALVAPHLVLVFGGQTCVFRFNKNEPLSDCGIWDALQQRWVAYSADCGLARAGHSLTMLPARNCLVSIGGLEDRRHYATDVHTLDIAALPGVMRWELLPVTSARLTHVPKHRFGHLAILARDESAIVVAGGVLAQGMVFVLGGLGPGGSAQWTAHGATRGAHAPGAAFAVLLRPRPPARAFVFGGLLGALGKDSRASGQLFECNMLIAQAARAPPTRLGVAASGAGASVPASSGFIDGSEIALGRELGRGAFGAVNLGMWRGAEVAVKRLIDSGNLNADEREAFAAESRIVAGLQRHPHVVPFLGLATMPSGELCIVTELCRGGSLRASLLDASQAWPYVRWLSVMRGVAAGMLHLSLEGVLHRDLSARNVLLGGPGLDAPALVADFGLSRMSAPRGTAGAGEGHFTESSIGPVRHMAPEALRRLTTTASDVWAFGVTMWEVQSRGALPYAELGPAEVVAGVLAGTLSLSAGPECPAWWASLQTSSMAWRPDERPSFAAIVAAFDAELARVRLAAGASAPVVYTNLGQPTS